MTVRGHRLAADWSRHGTYANTLEDLTSYLEAEPALTASWGRDLSQASGNSTAGDLTFGLINRSRAFNPENPTSPIAGKVRPGTPVRWEKTHLGTIHTLFDGVLADFDADPNNAAKTFTGEALDAWGRPSAEKLSTPVHTGLRTGDAMHLILDAIGWTGARDIDPGATYIAWWWEEGTDAAEAVRKLVDSEGPPAIAYVQGGTFTFRDRHHRLTRAASQTSQGTYTHIVPAGTGPAGDFKILKGSFRHDHGLRDIANSVTFEVPQRRPTDVIEVWATEDPITIAAGETVPVAAQLSDPVINAVAPVEDVDYTVQSGAVTVTLSRTSGQGITLFVTASSTAVVTRLALRASALPVVNTVRVVEELTVDPRERQAWPGTAPWANIYDARAVAQRILAMYGTGRPTYTFSIAGISDAYMTQILNRKVSDRITLRNDEMGINADVIIERITHTVRMLTDKLHTVEFVCQPPEPTQPANVLTFDVAGKGFNQGAFGVSGIDNPATMFTFDVAGRGFNQGVFAT